MRNNWRL